ncbi:tautomerase family protein [Arenibaculum pallidiluteum]|uniref:tautomerase family protein n=1 Tax=Arenibaculum pallidiluteum TaxID=2812559 RepID=UPI001A97CCB6|nr:4-oxalocrotonate tautomerase family protein [Arenibaculum pallidiluteum]
MPILNVKISARPTPDLAAAIARGLVEITARVLRKNPAITAVAIDHVAPEHWIVGGRSLAEQGKRSFWLDIKVVEGTNTKDEKAEYLREVFAFMAGTLGELHEESYAYVHEVRADAYGYGGVTQEHRYVAGRLQSRAA